MVGDAREEDLEWDGPMSLSSVAFSLRLTTRIAI